VEIADDDSQQEVSKMTILIAFFMMAFLAAIIFTVVGYAKHQPILALFGAAFFLIVGGIAYAQSVSQWDVWYDLMFVAFIFGGLIAMVAFSLDRTERAARRTKAAAETGMEEDKVYAIIKELGPALVRERSDGSLE